MRPMRVIDGGITAPEGFKACGRHVGIKKIKKDMALLTSDVEVKAAGCYTQNLVKAAPVLWNKAITESRKKVRVAFEHFVEQNFCESYIIKGLFRCAIIYEMMNAVQIVFVLIQ